MKRAATLFFLFLFVPLCACGTTEDPADEEFYFAEARGEQNLALSYLKRAQYARKKQVEYLELAETQEERLRVLRAEITQRRADNNKRAQQVQGLKKESATLANEVKSLGDAKKASAEKKKAVTDQITAEKAAIAKLEAELKALNAKKKAKEDEAKQLREAFGGK